MTLAQVDALAGVANRAQSDGRDSRQWGNAADLVALAGGR